ncbi:putative late blight resistance protein homolog R1A-3 [Solanum stenotomum]|uniref:putative late blight resistance protein homolog R1A-3 n=1 Tax=Solanum stenotomum TaxID=172797 RepID=UPI0020D10C97|nr:putative late blight resistance protein homolog R1A-3 [Solanum stenotomum]
MSDEEDPYPYPDPDPVSILQTIENEHEDLTDDKKKEIKLIKTELWFLGRFLLLRHCAWSGSLQMRIRSLLVFAEDLYRSNFDADPSYVLGLIEHFKYFIPINYLDSEESLLPVTMPLTHKHMLEYIDNVVQYFKDLLIVRLVRLPDVQSQVESFVKELRALKKFIFFLGEICISTEQINCWQTFWLHVRFVTTRAAIFLYLPCYDRFSHMMENNLMCSQIVRDDELLKYILKLSSFNSTHVYWYLDEAADEFMDFLLHVHMQLGADSWTTDQKYTFPEQINRLRVLFKELPLINDIQDEMRIDFFKRLVTLVIHAGLTVYSRGNWDQKLLLLDGMIRSVKTEICHKIREWVTSHLPKNDKLGFSNCLLVSLKEFLSGHSGFLASVKDQIEVVHEELNFFEPFIMRVAEQGNNKHHELQNLVGRVIDKAYEVEYILDSFAISDVPLTFLRTWLLEIIREIELIKTELTKPKGKNMTSASQATDGELVGFTDVCKTIRDQLVGGSRELDVVSIVGMAGSGKTTLARSFINDDSIVSHFDFCAECRVSQEYTREDLLFSILSSANSGLTDISKRGADILADRLRKTLLPKRYLLIIDDVWAVQAWDDLRLCFPEAKKGSRIILTTRLKEVATYAKCVTEPIHLRSMKDSESWLLLQKKVFGEEMCPEELKEVGQNIAFKCNGLPLSIVLVAGLLAKIDKTERCWTRMELSFGERVQDGAKDLVKLSYEDLPNKLKSCFLYFGAFLEDREILVSKLTSLWIAEAFIKNNEDKCLEDTAEDYLKDLIGRNLIMVTKRRSTGKIKACRVHDLMLDFCKEKAKEDNFLLWLKRDRDSNPPRFYSERPIHRRLSFCSNRDDLSEWKPSSSHARSILFRELSDSACSSMRDAYFIFGNFKFLRVLDLEVVVVDSFPTELNQLRYLAVQTTKSSIPSSIENLWNLQTFIVKGNGEQVWLPDTFWKLSKLRYVSISDGALFASRDAQESCDENSLKLDNLKTFSSIYVSRVNNMEKMLRRTPNLRKLRCVFADLGRWGKNENRFPVLDSLSQLETLKVVFVGISEVGPSRLNFPENLKKLTLCKFPLPPEAISTIAKLVNLEVLKLRQVAFEMGEWEVRDEEFSKLKLLELENLKLSKWEVSENAFHRLEKLVLHGCLHLEAIPDGFQEPSCLRYIKVKSCSEDVAGSARIIKQTREDYGDKFDVKIFS